ncbi:MAG TPA: tetratricopeptide repeat-containing protein [Allosphingosinicella sp.]|nr:tetratricopeptide repeat-containing protein [Allosphingosinicella sp.]
MVSAAPLATIIAFARAGALDHAWCQFRAAGYDRQPDDPAALAVKGRLLKDRAVQARGDERRRLYRESAAAYLQSAALRPSTYPLINAATLSLLAGDPERAVEIAGEVLERVSREPEEPETPYWRAATEAEALLLVGRFDEARAKLGEAIAAAPRAWEDHASTLRQFLLIHEALGRDAVRLEMLRPPRSLFFSGRIGLSEAAAMEAAEAVAGLIARERIGFGYGALAAGADIVVAEALLASGSELHVVLPSDAESFARHSVDPYGEAWRERFDAALAAAEAVYPVRPLERRPDGAMIELADDVAMGMARLNAERLLTEARELVVGTPRPGRRRPEHLIEITAESPPASDKSADSQTAALHSLVLIRVGSAEDQAHEARLGDVRQALAGTPTAIAPYLDGDDVIVGYSGVAEAAEAVRQVHTQLAAPGAVGIAAHHGLISTVRDPFSAALRPTGKGAAILKAIAQAAPPEIVCASLDFAAALAAGSDGPSGATWIGELQAFDGGPAIPLYALHLSGSDD